MVFTNGEAIANNNLIFNLLLFFISYLYFVWHWLNGGRTLGMRAWHIKLINREMDQMSWRNATARFLSGPAFTCLFRTWLRMGHF